MNVGVTERAEPRMRRLEELYVRHAPDAVRLAFILTADRELARDIAQDSFVRVAGRFQHLRVPDAFEFYLRRTVVNLAMSALRRRKVERAYLQRESNRTGMDAVQGPDVGVRDELRQSLERLPARQRAALVLRYYGDLSEQQVADAMNCSVSAARSLIARGMETLRGSVRNEES